ncbi:hypothetical protein ACJX0J_042433, partial [Zea mays]
LTHTTKFFQILHSLNKITHLIQRQLLDIETDRRERSKGFGRPKDNRKCFQILHSLNKITHLIQRQLLDIVQKNSITLAIRPFGKLLPNHNSMTRAIAQQIFGNIDNSLGLMAVPQHVNKQLLLDVKIFMYFLDEAVQLSTDIYAKQQLQLT